MTNYWIEIQTGRRPLTLAVSPPGAGAGDREKLSFDTRQGLEAYLRHKLQLSQDAISIALEKGAVGAPLPSSVVEQFGKDLELRTHG